MDVASQVPAVEFDVLERETRAAEPQHGAAGLGVDADETGRRAANSARPQIAFAERVALPSAADQVAATYSLLGFQFALKVKRFGREGDRQQHRPALTASEIERPARVHRGQGGVEAERVRGGD